VVDTTGAGDTFVGSLAVELASGKSVREAIQFAQYAAALKVTKLGAQTSIPHRDEVERFIQSRALRT
jgi:ribokinase